MASRFEKFSERARRVLSLAQEEAQRFNHNYIGTEHILLGLARESDGTAAKVLNGLSVELSKVRSAVEFVIGKGDSVASGEIGLTPRAKKVIELDLEHPWITEPRDAVEIALTTERAGLSLDERLLKSDSAGVSTTKSLVGYG
ncbi:MAG: hypothetical protein CL699_05775, partial [Chloroflexi bacterium]|nr:hypothetical protein [Chloroflexota bacterium]